MAYKSNNGLQLLPVEIDDNYRKRWNETMNDFIVLVKNGKLVNDSIYRVGGFGCDLTKRYFGLIKYVESIYSYEFLKKCYPNKTKKELKLHRRYLDGHFTILNNDGIEKKEFDGFEHPYLVDNSCIYTMNNNYYNVETGELYCYSSTSMESSEFLFLNNQFDKDLSKRGVMQINKKTGEFKIFY